MRILLAFAVLSLLVSCTDKPKSYDAIVGEAREVKADDLGKQYRLDTEQSIVKWVGTKPTGRHTGTFDLTEGTITVQNSEITSGSFTIDMASVKVVDLQGEDNQKLTKHLKSPDFFDLVNHPFSRFEITDINEFARSIEDDEDVEPQYMIQNPTHIVTGNLVMRGKNLSITFPARILVSDNLVTAEAKFNIDRTRWGVSWGDENLVDKLRDAFAHNTVNVGFSIQAFADQTM